MPEVFRNSDEIVTVGPQWLQRLKDAARESPLRRSRLCLHRVETSHESRVPTPQAGVAVPVPARPGGS